MCIIIHKPKEIRISRELIRQCWRSNNDGAGICFRLHSGDYPLKIIKGLMSPDRLWREISDRMPEELVIHFRLASHGKASPGLTHPFPICNSLELLQYSSVLCHRALAHNGIISGYGVGSGCKGLSDTAEFVRDAASRVPASALPALLRAVGGKFALIDKDGVQRIGAWTEEKGLYFSNTSYKFSGKTTYTYKPGSTIPTVTYGNGQKYQSWLDRGDDSENIGAGFKWGYGVKRLQSDESETSN